MKSLVSFGCGMFAGSFIFWGIVTSHLIFGCIGAFALMIIAQAISHALHMYMKNKYEDEHQRSSWDFDDIDKSKIPFERTLN